METYFIVTNNGFLKLYYKDTTNDDQPSFSSSVRNAKVFKTVEEARQEIEEKSLENVLVINRLGNTQ